MPFFNKPYDLKDSPTLQHYITDFRSPICAVMSHVNSGKTTAMVMKAALIAANQHPDANGVRWTQHGFIRGTHADLLRNIVRSFEDTINPKLVQIRKSPPVSGRLRMHPMNDADQHFPKSMWKAGKTFPYYLGATWNPEIDEFEGGEDVSGVRIGDIFPNGTHVDALFDFMALDNPDWQAALLGYNPTAFYFDEPDSMSNIADVLPELPTRVGRYPSADVAPVTCAQINMAFNPPPRSSWSAKFFSGNAEKLGRKLYRIQPPFLLRPDPAEPENFHKADFVRNPDAEGVRYASDGYRFWERIIDSNRHEPDKIRRTVLGEFTTGASGNLVHTGFRENLHVVPHIRPQRQKVLFTSLDWGLKGAALFCQYDGGVRVLEEMPAEGPSHEFVREQVIPHLNSEYRGFEIVITGDPSGRYRRDTGDSPFQIFEDAGYLVEGDTAMDPEARWSAVNHYLSMHGGLQISEDCTRLIEGFTGGYVFKKQRDGTTLRQVNKTNPLTAFQDCLQAVCCLMYSGYESAGRQYAAEHTVDSRRQSPKGTFLWV